MEHVNDDMDNLFRKAGELYPLKTTESDWDSVLGKLRDEIAGDTGTPFAVPSRSNANRRRWLLLLLVPAFIFSLVYFSKSRVAEKAVKTAGQTKGNPDGKKTDDANEISNATGRIENKNADKAKSKLNSTVGNSATARAIPIENGSGKPTGPVSGHEFSSANQNNGKGVISETNSEGHSGNSSTKTPSNNLNGPESLHEPVEKSLSLSVYGLKENPSVYGMPFPPLVSKDVSLNNATTKTSAITKTNKTNTAKGIYAVVLGGPDMSRVSFQSTEQPGYSLGILLGYRFNKRIAIETGLLYDKKFYYSDGEYFDKSKTSIPSWVDIKNLNGNCNMFEIPLSFRYDFSTGTNHGFFATAGLSSYLMKKENYTYNAKVYYPQRPAYDTTYSKSYDKSNNYFFSIVHLSAGYERRIGINTTIRVEPYMNIPLQGIGIGSMSISSAGLYFGISHSFR
jgi:hypothetical protein